MTNPPQRGRRRAEIATSGYGNEGIHIIVTPRATPRETLDKWVVGGRAAAITSGAFSLSSNHVSSAADAVHLGGQGWVIAPDGEVLGLTSPEQPFVTIELDLSAADRARLTYPRYVFEGRGRVVRSPQASSSVSD